MPTLQDITVKVTDASQQPLQEDSIQIVDQHNIICSIHGQVGTHFQIAIRPGDRLLWHSKPHFTQHLFEKATPYHEQRHLLATVRFNGTERPQKQTIVFLDTDSESFQRRNGRFCMSETTVPIGNGTTARAYKWMFRDGDIAARFDGLNIMSDEDSLVTDMENLGHDWLEQKQKTPAAGVIEVALDWVQADEGDTYEGVYRDPGGEDGGAQSGRDALVEAGHDRFGRLLPEYTPRLPIRGVGGHCATFKFFS